MEPARFTITVNHKEIPSTEEQILVEVDLLALAKMFGSKAVHSKGGKSTVAHGCVVVRHIRFSPSR